MNYLKLFYFLSSFIFFLSISFIVDKTKVDLTDRNNIYESEKQIMLKNIYLIKQNSNEIAPRFRMAPISDTKTNSNISISTMSYYNPKKDRDPTLSPEDYYKIQKEKERIENLKKEKLKQIKQKKIVESPKGKINLQGIVGNIAIIDGEMINEGQTINGFKVLKVGSSYVIGLYNGRKYRLDIK